MVAIGQHGGRECRRDGAKKAALAVPAAAYAPLPFARVDSSATSASSSTICPNAAAAAAAMSEPPAEWNGWVQGALHQLQQQQLVRQLRPVVPTLLAAEAKVHDAELEAWAQGRPSQDSLPGAGPAAATNPSIPLREVTLFSTNDYLGLSTHPDVCSAAAAAAQQAGMGPRSSALVSGFTQEHRQLERELAALKGTQDCLLFPTGYAANMAVATVLGGASGVAIFSDALNHASIIDGVQLACRRGATLQVYRHNDMQHLEQLLAAAPPGARKLIVTDSLFSMDGDYADLPALARLRRRHGALLVIDEAHATLVCGDKGGGAAEMMGVADQVDVHVGTLSKAAGSLGGFAACTTAMRNLLLNRGRPVVFSTSLPVPVVAAARAALRVASRESWRRQHLRALTARLAQLLQVPACSPIIPLVVGSEDTAMELSQRLLSLGLHVPAIRPPTVPAGTCRLRVSLTAAHTFSDVERLAGMLQQLGTGFQALPHLVKQAHQHGDAFQHDRPDQRHHPHFHQQQQQQRQQQQRQQQQLPILQQPTAAADQPLSSGVHCRGQPPGDGGGGPQHPAAAAAAASPDADADTAGRLWLSKL